MSAPDTPSTADILTAIQELRTYIDVRFTKVGAEMAAVETRMQAEMAAMETRTRTEMAAMEARLSAQIETEARVVAARLDEQRHTLNSLIPTFLATVPPSRKKPAA